MKESIQTFRRFAVRNFKSLAQKNKIVNFKTSMFLKPIFFILFCSFVGMNVFAQSVQTLPLPSNNNQTSYAAAGGFYGPMASTAVANQYSRYAYVYPQSLIGVSNANATGTITTSKIITTLEFDRGFDNSVIMSGTTNFKIYVVNLTAATTNWGATTLSWSAQIATSTLVFDGNPNAIINAGAKPGNVSFPINAFTYTGGSLGILVEYTQVTAQTAEIAWGYENSATISQYVANSALGVVGTGTPSNTLGNTNNQATPASVRHPTLKIDYVGTATVPGAPTNVTATAAGNAQATVSFLAPASNGGSNITSYTVTASSGGITATGSGSPIIVTGLTNGTAYTFTVKATNSIGSGVASAASNSVTPVAACTTPSTPTLLNFSSTQNTITGSFTGSVANGYLIIRTATATAPTTPSNSVTYTAGTSVLGGFVVASGTSTSFTDNTNLTPSTQYYYWVYAYNNTSCTGGPTYNTTPLSGNTTTSACVVATNTLQVTYTSTGNSGTTTYNWSTAPWSLGHAPYACENAVIILQKTVNGAGAMTVTLDVPVTVNNLTLTGTYGGNTTTKQLTVDASTFPLIINGNLSISANGGSLANSSSTQLLTSNSILIKGTSTIGGTSDNQESIVGFGTSATSSSSFTFGGDVTFNVSGITDIGTVGQAIFNKGSSQILTNNSTAVYTDPITFYSATVTNNTSLTLAGTQPSGTYLAGGPLTINSGSALILPATYSLNQEVTGSTFTINSGGTLKVGGPVTAATNFVAGSNFPGGFTTYSFNSTSIVEYNGATQTIYSTPTYGNLTLSTSGTKTAGGALTVAGSLLINTGATYATNFATTVTSLTTVNGTYTAGSGTQTLNGGLTVAGTFTGSTGAVTTSNVNLNSGTLTAPSGAFNVKGDWTKSGGTFVNGSNTVTFAGTSQQTLTGATIFGNITLTNPGGLDLEDNETVTGTFTFPASGLVSTNTNALIIGAAGAIANASANAYIDGNLAWTYNATTLSHVFPVGNSGAYRPATFTYPTLTGTSIVVISDNETAFTGTVPSNVRLYTGRYYTVGATGGGTSYSLTLNGTGFNPTGTPVMLKSDGTVTSYVNTTTPNYTNATYFTTALGSATSPSIFALGQTNIPLTITGVTVNTKVYDGTTAATLNTSGATLNGVISGDNVTLSSAGATGTFNNKNAGTNKPVTTSGFTLSGSSAGYYTLSQPALTGTITPKALTASLTGNVTKPYDGTTAATLTASNFSLAGIVSGDVVTVTNTTGTYGNPNVGTGKNVTVTNLVLGGTDAANYTVSNASSVSGNIGTITARALTITANNGSKTYGQTYPTGTGSAAFTSTGLVNGETIGSVTISSTGAPASAAVGTYSIIPSAATGGTFTASNYTITYTNGTLTVNPAPLTITANDQTKCAGQSFTFNGTEFTSSGLQNGQTVGSVTLTSAAASAGAAAGTYPIVPSAATGGTFTASNYSINYTNGTFTVTALPVATISYAGNPYCSAAGTATVTQTGTAGGTYSSTPGLSINPTTGAVDLGASSLGNYTVTYTFSSGTCSNTTTATITINPSPTATISGTATVCQNSSSPNVTFTGANGTAPYTFTYKINGGSNQTVTTASGNSVTVAAPTTTAGTYTYTLVSVSGQFCSQAQSGSATITVTTAPSAAISYSGSPYCSGNGTATVTRTGTAGGSYSSTAGLTINSGTGAVTLGTSTPGTYTVTYTVAASGGCAMYTTTGSITINAAPSATISYAGSPYCSNSGTATVTQTGTAGGSYSSTAGLTINSGTGAVTLGTSTPGTYTVTYTVAASGGCAMYTTTGSITINAAPSATISYAGSPYCSNGGTATVTQTGTAGGTYSSPNGLVINSTTGAVDLNSAINPAGTYTVNYDVSGTGGCSATSTQATTSLTIMLDTWTGSTSTAWNDGSNWSCGVPTSATDVSIPNGSPRYPVISGSYSVRGITIASSASLTIDSATVGVLTITGAYSNAGVLANNGRVVLNGTATQTFPGGSAANLSMSTLEINNTSGVTLDKSITIRGAILPTAGTLALGNNYITLRSDSTSNTDGTPEFRSARIGVDGSATPFTYVNGRFVIERYFHAKRAWRLITAPVTKASSSTIFNGWQLGGATTATGAPLGSGVLITGNYTATNGFDKAPNKNPSLKIFEPTTGALNSVVNTKPMLLSPGTYSTTTDKAENIGYFNFVRGDRDPTLLNLTYTHNTTLRDTGKVQTGTQTFTFPLASNTDPKFVLLPNPYASPVDFQSIYNTNQSNIEQRFYAWDPELGDANSVGGYVTYDLLSGATPNNPPGHQTQYIQSTQAVYLQTSNATTVAVTVNESDKTGDTINAPLFRPLVFANSQLAVNLKFLNTGNSPLLADGILAQFSSAYSDAIDNNDAIKFLNPTESFAFSRDGKLLSIERRNQVTREDTLYFNFTKGTKRSYELEFIPEGLESTEAFLVDSYLKTSTPVSMGQTSAVSFSITEDAGSAAADRFMIVFRPSATLPVTFTKVKAYQQGSNINVEWNIENEVNIKQYEVERSTDGRTFSKSITLTATKNNGTTATYSWPDASPVNGANYYRIKSISKTGEVQYSLIVKVTTGNGRPVIAVYPNPATGGRINLQLINQPAGRYNIRLLDKLGQVILSRQTEHAEGSSTESLEVSKAMAHGNYQLEITKPDNNKTVINVLY